LPSTNDRLAKYAIISENREAYLEKTPL